MAGHRPWSAAALLAVAALCVPVRAEAQETVITLEDELLAEGDAVAGAVATDGDRIVVGVPADDTVAEDAGAAHVFVRSGSTWSWEQTLLPDAEPSMAFGHAVAIDGDVCAIGAPGPSGSRVEALGSVYLFRRTSDGWVRDDRVEQSSVTRYQLFGWSVALWGDWLIVGSPQATLYAGAVHFFRASDRGWGSPRGPLVPSPEPPDADFGWSVDYDGQHLLVGAPAYGRTGTDPTAEGAAYVYSFTDGRLGDGQLLRPATPQTDAGFGWSVSLQGRWALVGAPLEDRTADGDEGNVHGFFMGDDGTWTRTWSYEDSVEPGASLATSLALEGSVLFLGAPADATDTVDGSVLVRRLRAEGFDPSGTIAEPASPDFGLSLDAAGSTLVVSGASHTHVYSFAAECTEDADCDDADPCTDDACASACQYEPSSACEEPAPGSDAGVGDPDAGADGGSGGDADAGGGDAGPGAEPEAEGGCACRTVPQAPVGPLPLALLLLVLRSRRRCMHA